MTIPAHELDRLRRTVTGRSRTGLVLQPDLSDEERDRLAALSLPIRIASRFRKGWYHTRHRGT